MVINGIKQGYICNLPKMGIKVIKQEGYGLK